MDIGGGPQDRRHRLFREWMHRQEADLEELLRAKAAAAATAAGHGEPSGGDREGLKALVAKVVRSYEAYVTQRCALAREYPPPFLCPRWCSAFESSVLWLGGCRPSMFIRLLYTLSGTELEARLEEFLNGVRLRRADQLAELSARQLAAVNDLHLETVRGEGALASRMACLQEDVADEPLVPPAVAAADEKAHAALESYRESLAAVVREADGLRMSTLRRLVGILSPLQAVEYLAAAKQLQFAVHEWGHSADRAHGGG